MFPQFDASAERNLLTKGMAASPGAAVGKVVFDSATAVEWKARGERVLLVRKETNSEDLEGMIAATGILTSRGGKTSHAAVVARGMGKTAVCGAESLEVDAAGLVATAGGVTVQEGDVLSIDGSTGEVFVGELPVVPSPVVLYLEEGLDTALEKVDEGTADVVRAVDRLLSHADGVRRLRVWPTPTWADADRRRRMGAEGIGLCRTEHMFLGERRPLIERVVLADNIKEREAALAELVDPQTQDFVELLTAMDGLPTTIRLLDPPLHEFLPDRAELMVKVAVARDATRSSRTTSVCWRRSTASTSRTRCSGFVASDWASPCLGCSPSRSVLSPRRRRNGSRPAGTRARRSWCPWSARSWSCT